MQLDPCQYNHIVIQSFILYYRWNNDNQNKYDNPGEINLACWVINPVY